MKELSVTLYDIFGYLVPGSIFLAGSAIVYWTAFGMAPADIDAMTAPVWIAVAVIAYLFGHMVQAVANLLMKGFTKTPDLVLKPKSALSAPVQMIELATSKAAKILELPAGSTMSTDELYEICDHFVQQKCNTATRDIYVYREGFYRGICIGFVFLSLSLLLRVAASNSTMVIAHNTLHFSHAQIIVLFVVCAFFAWLSFTRFRRFGQYLVKNALYCFLVGGKEDFEKRGAPTGGTP